MSAPHPTPIPTPIAGPIPGSIPHLTELHSLEVDPMLTRRPALCHTFAIRLPYACHTLAIRLPAARGTS